MFFQAVGMELMVKWSENTGNNGMIVCLDQENEYDRIDLIYLWKTLEACGFRRPS